MIKKGRELVRDIEETADAVVVGTGAGGGMAIRELVKYPQQVIRALEVMSTVERPDEEYHYVRRRETEALADG